MSDRNHVLRVAITPNDIGDLVRALRLPVVCRVFGLRRSLDYQLGAEEKFPRRVRIHLRAIGWDEHEIRKQVARALKRAALSIGGHGVTLKMDSRCVAD